MTIVYDVVEADVVRLRHFSFRNNRTLKRALLTQQLVASCIVVVIPLVVLGLFSRFGLNAYRVLAALGGGALFFVYQRRQFLNRLCKEVHKQAVAGELKHTLGVHHLTLTPEGIEQRSPQSEGKVLWSGIDSIVATVGNVFIFINNGANAIIIANNAFADDAQKKEFMNTADRFYRAARGEEHEP